MADDDKGGGSDNGGGGAGGFPPVMPFYGGASPFGAPMYLPLPAATDRTEIKFSDAVPGPVRAELNWVIKTAKQGRMAVGVVTTCHKMLLVILKDLEKAHHLHGSGLFGTKPAVKRLQALQHHGAVTKAVVDEARLIQLTPAKKPQKNAAPVGNPTEATRYVAFLRMLVDVAYEAPAKYRKNQQPASKQMQGVAMTFTVGPNTSGSGGGGGSS